MICMLVIPLFKISCIALFNAILISLSANMILGKVPAIAESNSLGSVCNGLKDVSAIFLVFLQFIYKSRQFCALYKLKLVIKHIKGSVIR